MHFQTMIPCGVRFFDLSFHWIAYVSLGVGIAYTIDPVYESEVRDYLGLSFSREHCLAFFFSDMIVFFFFFDPSINQITGKR